MDDASLDLTPVAPADIDDIPVAELNPAQAALFAADTHWRLFDRLRREDPVHYTPASEYGPFWSITRYRDILQVEKNHDVFSSDVSYGGITLKDQELDFVMPMFIAMDPPVHDEQRAAVNPIISPFSLVRLEKLIRERSAAILDALPIDEPFDWVDKVSIELTTQMLATLFDFPMAERRKLTRWSDVAVTMPGAGIINSEKERQAEMLECLLRFTDLWNERVNAPPTGDLISLMAHDPATRDQTPMAFLGNLLLLIVGGNDTTRNSITGGLYALNKFPEQYSKLLADHSLIPSMVGEIVRWQTPLAHMRRTSVRDIEFGGKHIRKGDKVVMWYVSGNRDDEVIADPYDFIIDRPRPKQHLSFGFGLHRCLGEKLAEMQLKIMWEEILARFGRIEVLEEPGRVFSIFIKGYTKLMVRIPAGEVRAR